MKKFNLIIGKRQIVIVALLITLSVAAFLNWQFATNDDSITVMDTSDRQKNEENEETEKTQSYGEAELVSKNEKNKGKNINFIKQAKLDKSASYDEAIENNNKLLNSQNLNQEDRSKIIDKSLQLTEKKNQEDSIESQIKNKNFIEDCVTYIEDGRVNATVKAKNLNENQITNLKDIIVGVTNYSPSNIVITPVED